MKIRLRNISGRPIYDIGASLYFKPSGVRMLFRIPLTPTQPRNLKQQSLQPREELELQVNEELSNRMIQQMRQYGVEPNESQISLSVDAASFSDDFGWDRGVFTRRDPYMPNKLDHESHGIPFDAPANATRLALLEKLLTAQSYSSISLLDCLITPRG